MENPPETVYRVRAKFRITGIISIVLFSIFGAASVYVAYYNVDGSFARPELAAMLFGLFWSAWVALGAWLLLFQHRYRLIVNPGSIRQVGIFSDRLLYWSDVRQLRWRCFPALGSARLESASGVLCIDLGNFDREPRLELIDCLRSSIALQKQVGWEAYKRQFAATSQFAKTPQQKARARNVLLVIFGLHVPIFIGMWFAGFGNQFAIAAALNASGVGLILWRRNQA